MRRIDKLKAIDLILLFCFKMNLYSIATITFLETSKYIDD